MPYYAYVVRSLHCNFLYKGHCEDLDVRLRQHNQGFTASLKPYIPVELVYFETYDTREEAIKRERYLKSSAGRKFLKKEITV